MSRYERPRIEALQTGPAGFAWYRAELLRNIFRCNNSFWKWETYVSQTPVSAPRFHAFEGVAVIPLPVVDFAEKQVAFRIGRDVVNVEELPRVVPGMTAHRSQRLQRPSVQNANRLV